MPVAIWTCLKPDPALRFDCVVDGDDYFLALPPSIRRHQETSSGSGRMFMEGDEGWDTWKEDYGESAEA